MQRVGILINKLQEQLQQQTGVEKMLLTAQMLYTELLHEKETGNGSSGSQFVAITSPEQPPVRYTNQPEFTNVEEKEEAMQSKNGVADVTPEPEVTMQEEPEPAGVLHVESEEKDLASAFLYDTPFKQPEAAKWSFNPADVPTLAQQQKVIYELKDTLAGDEPSLNDKLKENTSELGALLHDTPIRDLKKAISINDRHRFIEALFRGDETMYERSIKTINNFSIYAEAEFWIQRELKLKLGWDANLHEVKVFDQLVKRRFS